MLLILRIYKFGILMLVLTKECAPSWVGVCSHGLHLSTVYHPGWPEGVLD